MKTLDKTKSICPKCKNTVDAQILVKGKKVYMKKHCTNHGWFNSLISSDVKSYLSSKENFSNFDAERCTECSECTAETQKTNIALIDINDACNINCPVCINDTKGNSHFTIEKIEWMIDQYVKKEGSPEILQLSGGEPTIHPKFFEILDMALKKNIRLVMVNTNGYRIATEETFAKELSRRNVLVYLQFDGLKSSTYKNIRGLDLSKIKIMALENMRKYKIRAFLASTIIRGINEKEVGDIVNLAMKYRNIEGIDFHSVAYTGRCIKYDPKDRITMPDIIKAIEKQTNGTFKKSDFLPMPATDPRCCRFTYAFLCDGKVKVIPRLVNLKKYKKYFNDTIIHNPKVVVKDVINGRLPRKALYTDFKKVVGEPFNPLTYINLKSNLLKIMIKPFMDPYTFDIKRAKRCAVHQILPDGRFVSFCVYTNMIREQTRR